MAVASSTCAKCGQPLPAGAGFCTNCGTPVAAPLSSDAPPVPPLDLGATGGPADPPPPTGPPLAAVLGLEGSRKFLLQHLLVGARHSYRILDGEKRPICSFGENVRAEREALVQQIFHPAPNASSGSRVQVHWGTSGFSETWFWLVEDAGGNIRGTITLQQSGPRGRATVVDPTGAPVLAVQTHRSGFETLEASASAPDGRPTLEARGKLLHHEFGIFAPGGAEVAKVHEAWASVRDTYAVDLLGPTDPLAVLVLAVLIDHFKGR